MDNDKSLDKLNSSLLDMSVSDQSRSIVEESDNSSFLEAALPKIGEIPGDNPMIDEEILDSEGFEIIEGILNKCEPSLVAYLGRFKDAKIVNSVALNLSKDTIEGLFPTELGYRDILRKGMEKYRSSKEAKFVDHDSEKNVLIAEKYKLFQTWKKKVSIAQINTMLFSGAHIIFLFTICRESLRF